MKIITNNLRLIVGVAAIVFTVTKPFEIYSQRTQLQKANDCYDLTIPKHASETPPKKLKYRSFKEYKKAMSQELKENQ